MDWREALEIVVGRTKHERYRELCADDHPNREMWRAKMVEKATGEPTPAAYPSAARQAANLAGSLWDWAVSGFMVASQEEQDRRLAICHGCEQWDEGRCRICGCHLAAKVKMKTGHCPIGKW